MTFTELADVLGGAPHARVLGFLVEQSGFDHTITDIARGAGVARLTAYRVVDDFIDSGLLTRTRVVGKSQFYRLNGEHALARALLALEEGEGGSPHRAPGPAKRVRRAREASR